MICRRHEFILSLMTHETQQEQLLEAYQICTVCGASLQQAMVYSLSTMFVDSCKHCSVTVFHWEMATLQQLLLSKVSGTVKAYKDASWPWLDRSCFRSCIPSRSIGADCREAVCSHRAAMTGLTRSQVQSKRQTCSNRQHLHRHTLIHG